ncbi:MAG: helix-turn-helix domain-containing protein [Pseudonocardiaceae bacterium]
MTRNQLTHRENQVLELVIRGLSNDEIATHLAISRRTVEAHLRMLFRKTGVARRAQLAALYQGSDMVATERPEAEQPGAPAPSPPRQHRDLADCERQLRAYADAVRGLSDRQSPLFEERLEITLLVGERDGQDTVLERRWTTPMPYLVYRVLAPILNLSDSPPLERDDLALDCRVEGQDIDADVHLVWNARGRPQVMILFQPGLQAETEWVLRYRSPTLWNPLRASGQDTLTWFTATLDQRRPPKTNELTVKVVFPSSWTDERLTERGNLGVIHTERLPTGQTQLTWHHGAPGAGAYHWELHGSRG